ncbi:MAG: efflux RND transporter periplasmic adaptor subunit [Muribaculaceae bacterium]|nr:efflux RND transporter periplasmic adaptor subunit [Muribaculaceae bacterium]
MHVNIKFKGALCALLYMSLMIGGVGCAHNHHHDHESENHDHNQEKSHSHKGEEHNHEAAESHSENPNIIFFPEEQSKTVEFATEKAERHPFWEVVRTMAFVEPSNGDERVVVAKASGIVNLAGDRLVDGKSVSAGETLFTIDATALADNNLSVKLREAESAWQFAKKEYERKQELVKDKIVSESDFQNSKAEYEKATANYEALRKGFSGGKSAGASPISGFVKRVYVRNGEYVEAGTPVASVAQNRNLYIRAEISPRKSAGLRNVTGATIKNPVDGKVYSLSELDGSLVSVGKGADMENPLVPVVFQVSNTVDFVPGTFVEMFITSGEGESLTVPVTALVEEMGNYFAFVEVEPEHYEKRQVVTGKTDGKSVQILGGVKEGETIVSKGAVLVKLAQASGKLDAHAGHVH